MAVQALPNPYKRVAASIATAQSMDEVAEILREFPEAIKSRSVTNTLMIEMSNILKRSSETVVSFPFMMAVIQCTQAYYELGEPSDAICADNHSVGKAGWQLLQFYLRAIVEKDKDACKNAFHRSPANTKYVQNCDISIIKDDYNTLLGIGFLMINFTRWDTLDQNLYRSLRWSRGAFLRTMMDIAVPSVAPDDVAQICQRIWDSVDNEATAEGAGFEAMLRHWDGNMEIATRLLQSYFTEHESNGTDSEIREDCMALFTQLANIVRSPFTAETFFYEYIEMLRTYYPLNEKRAAIQERYARYYGDDDTYSYMVSIYTAIMAGYGDAEHTPNALPYDSNTRINMEVERIIFHITAMHPQVNWRVTQLFFRDVLECHGFYLKHYAESAIPIANTILEAVERSKKKVDEQPEMNVVEALESTLQALYAMEDDMGYPDFDDDHKGEKVDHSGNNHEDEKAANSVDTRDLHKSSAKSSWEKFQENKAKVDSTINDLTMTIKKALAEGKQAILINGQPKSIIWTIAKMYAGFGVFRASKTGFALMMVVNHYLKKGSRSQRIRLLQDVQNELVMVNEKIQDAAGDGNREAKYELMRTKQNLLEAQNRLKYGVGAKMGRHPRNNLSSNTRGYGG